MKNQVTTVAKIYGTPEKIVFASQAANYLVATTSIIFVAQTAIIFVDIATIILVAIAAFV